MWFVATFALLAVVSFLADGRAVPFWELLPTLVQLSGWNALVGFITGGTFAAYIAANFRGRRFEDLNPGRFAVGGSLVTVPLTLIVVIWLRVGAISELPLLQDLFMPMLLSAALGGLTGFGLLKLAQSALPGPSSIPDELGHGSETLHSGHSQELSSTRLEPAR
jgi:hypothetical protein